MPNYALEAAAQRFPFRYAEEDLSRPGESAEQRHPADDVAGWAAQFLAPSGTTDTLALLRAMTIGLRERLSYARRTERGVQTPSETLRGAAALAATSPCGGPKLPLARLALASSADTSLSRTWMSPPVWAKVLLTLGFSSTCRGRWSARSTNCIIGNRNLIHVAVAWDASQVLPLSGAWTGFQKRISWHGRVSASSMNLSQKALGDRPRGTYHL